MMSEHRQVEHPCAKWSMGIRLSKGLSRNHLDMKWQYKWHESIPMSFLLLSIVTTLQGTNISHPGNRKHHHQKSQQKGVICDPSLEGFWWRKPSDDVMSRAKQNQPPCPTVHHFQSFYIDEIVSSHNKIIKTRWCICVFFSKCWSINWRKLSIKHYHIKKLNIWSIKTTSHFVGRRNITLEEVSVWTEPFPPSSSHKPTHQGAMCDPTKWHGNLRNDVPDFLESVLPQSRTRQLICLPQMFPTDGSWVKFPPGMKEEQKTETAWRPES